MEDRAGVGVEGASTSHASKRVAAAARHIADHRVAGDLGVVPLVVMSMTVEHDMDATGGEQALEVCLTGQVSVRGLRGAVRVERIVEEGELVRSGVAGEVVRQP